MKKQELRRNYEDGTSKTDYKRSKMIAVMKQLCYFLDTRTVSTHCNDFRSESGGK